MSDADHLLDEIIAQIRGEDIPVFPRELMAERLSGFSVLRQGELRPRERIQRWQFWQTIAAAMAVVLVLVSVITLGLNLIGGRAFAFADVAKAVGATQTMKCRILHFSNDPNYLRQYNVKAGEPAVSQLLRSGDRIRNEGPLDMVSIVNPEQGLMMSIWHKHRRAVIRPVPREELLKQAADFHAMLRNVPAASAKKLPDGELNGQPVGEFLIQKSALEFRVTVDPSTKLPLRMEVVYPKNPDKSQLEMREVYTDFVFDAPLDDSLFRIEAPAGYSVEREIPPNRPANPPETIELIVSPDEGIGPVKFGMKEDEIVRLLGEPDWRNELGSVVPSPGAVLEPNVKKNISIELNYHRRGFRLVATESSGLLVIECFAHRDGDSTQASFQGKTKEGITLNASLEDVLKTYGEPDGKLGSLHYWYPKRGYRFEFRDRIVVSINVMQPNPYIDVQTHGDVIIQRVKPQKAQP